MGNPKPRNPVKDYEKMWDLYLNKHFPDFMAAEDASRELYDPIRVEQDLGIQEAYGPIQREQTLDALRQLDPHAEHIRGQLASRVYADMVNPYGMPDDLRIEAENDIRGAQTARGNFMGNGAVTAESVYKGKLRNDLANTRIARAGAFLSTPSPVTQAHLVKPVAPDRPAGYVASPMQVGQQGANLGQMAFQNQQTNYQNQQQEPNYWMEALKVAGAAYGAYASDERLKNTIEDTGERTADGIPIVTFFYNGIAQKFRGVIAQAAQKIRPDAVIEHEGRLMVKYDLLGIRMQEVN